MEIIRQKDGMYAVVNEFGKILYEHNQKEQCVEYLERRKGKGD